MKSLSGVIKKVTKTTVTVLIENGMKEVIDRKEITDNVKRGDLVWVAFDFTRNKVKTIQQKSNSGEDSPPLFE